MIGEYDRYFKISFELEASPAQSQYCLKLKYSNVGVLLLNLQVSAPAFSNGTLGSDNQFPKEAVEEEDEEEEEQEEACLGKENAQGRVNCDTQTLQNTSSFNQNNNLITSDSSDVGPCNLCDNSNGEKPDAAKLYENGKPPTSSVRKDPAAGKGPMIRAVNIPYIFECEYYCNRHKHTKHI